MSTALIKGSSAVPVATSPIIAGGSGASSASTTRTVTATDSPEIPLLGAVTETAPATDTASSGINGRLQRLAQKLTSLIALLPTALGAGGGLKVDGSGTALPVSGTVAATVASGGVASGAVASGAFAAGSIASGAVVDGAMVTIGAKADAKSTATDTTAVTIMSVLKQISASVQLSVFGAGTASAAQRITIASDAPGIADATAGEYETVAASQTDQVMGSTGAVGDYLEAVLIVPANLNPAAVSIKDGSGSAITIFTGGTGSITDLASIYVPLGIKSTGVGWKITTGASVAAIGIGNFT
jgi:hypothetical protein